MQGIPAPEQLISQARAATGETQRVFAARLGSSQSLVCKYESGQVTPPPSLLIHCMNLLGFGGRSISQQELMDLVRDRMGGDGMAVAREALAQVIRCLPEATSVRIDDVDRS